MRKLLAIQKCYGGTDRRTDRHGKLKSRVAATKNGVVVNLEALLRPLPVAVDFIQCKLQRPLGSFAGQLPCVLNAFFSLQATDVGVDLEN